MLTVVGIDDTDSRTQGMCTTYVGTEIGRRIEAAGGSVIRHLLIRCNPAVKRKTRGNAAVALHIDADPHKCFTIAKETINDLAATSDPNTSPGLVVSRLDPENIPSPVTDFTKAAVTTHLDVSDAIDLIGRFDYTMSQWGDGNGIIGALAATGAWKAVTDWTYERLTYRDSSQWGSPRSVDETSVFEAADRWYPLIWDTVDRYEGEAVCVPNTPGPVLYGIRGDDISAIDAAVDHIESEAVVQSTLFHTNQGTDAHILPAPTEPLSDRHCYRVTGTVIESPETQTGGHVFFSLRRDSYPDETIQCAAFEPTKRFRDYIRNLRCGDCITVCGEYSSGTLKMEKFAMRDPVRSVLSSPTCSQCFTSMESAGADQGYRCKDCETTAPSKVPHPIERTLDIGWYEVPPVARRHIAKPLIRGNFDAPIYPER